MISLGFLKEEAAGKKHGSDAEAGEEATRRFQGHGRMDTSRQKESIRSLDKLCGTVPGENGIVPKTEVIIRLAT